MSGALVLGTAQWGMHYGIANVAGPPERDELKRLLTLARDAGVRALDTARAYGTSERRIGELVAEGSDWEVTTKLAPDVAPDGISASEAEARTLESLASSRRALRRGRLDTVLLHRAAHRHAVGGAVWAILSGQRRSGAIGRLGVSAATPEQAEALLGDPAVEVIQVATSLLDQRLLRSGFFEHARRSGRQVDVRSVFLQGVAHLEPDALPAALSPLREPLRRISRWSRARQLETAEAFLLFARTLPGVRLVLGCERGDQLVANLATWRRRPLDAAEFAELSALVPALDAAVLDPARWPASSATSR